MNKLKTGLCALLMGTSMLTFGQEVKPEYKIEFKSKITSVVASDSTYTFSIHTPDYYIMSIGREPILDGGYLDSYLASLNYAYNDEGLKNMKKLIIEAANMVPGWFLMVQRTKTVEEISTLHESLQAAYIRGKTDTIFSLLKGKKLKANASPIIRKDIVVDKSLASSSNYDIWMEEGDVAQPYNERLKEATKAYFVVTILTRKDDLYGITMMYHPLSKGEVAQADDFYKQVLDSFHVRK